jgi:hypothetical protein
MISLQQIAKKMEEKLNEEAANSELQALLPNTSFAFRLVLDTADYQPPERFQNHVINYINGLVSISGSEAEGINSEAESYSATMFTNVDFLIPISDLFDEDGASKLTSAVRDIIGEALQSGSSDEMYDDDNNMFLVGSYYNISSSGLRDTRERVGDSMTLSLGADFYFIGLGVASSAYELYYVYEEDGEEEEERIYFSTSGLVRKTVSSSALTAEDASEGKTGSKSTPESTMMTISITAPMRRTKFGELCDLYVAQGSTEPFIIKLKFATIAEPVRYKMIFDNSGISNEINLASSLSCAMLEYMDLEE